MGHATPLPRLVLTTSADHDEAARLARALVEEGLAACATLGSRAPSPSIAGRARSKPRGKP